MTEKRDSLSSPFPRSSSAHSTENETEIGTNIVEYMCVGDEIYYDHHIFALNVWNEKEKLSYTIQRSYSSFCEFHARLAKKYPKTALPTMPLSDYQRFAKLYEKLKNNSSGNSSNSGGNSGNTSAHQNVNSSSNQGTNDKLTSRLSIMKSQKTNDTRLKRKDTTSEVISQKRALLSRYLDELLSIPEVLTSEETSIFFDEESDDGLTLSHPETSAVDISLLGEDSETRTIMRSYEILKDVECEGYVVVWSFRTKSKDIGFSVEFNGKTVVPYQRYDSHAHMVSGMISVPEKGQARLVWDNTYSKLRSKVLTYRVRIVDAVEFETASRIADEKGKERQRLEQQRQLLKRIFSAHFKQMFITNGTIFSQIRINDHKAIATDRLTAIYQDQEDEIRILREEKSGLEHRASTLEVDLEAEKLDSQSLSESIEELEGIRDQLEKELKEAKESEAGQNQALSAKDEQIASLQMELQLQHKRISDEMTNAKKFEAMSMKLKAEKKQLKAYALQLKAQADTWAIEKKDLETILADLERRNADHLNREKIREECDSSLKTKHVDITEKSADVSKSAVNSIDSRSACEMGHNTHTTSNGIIAFTPWEQLLASDDTLVGPHNIDVSLKDKVSSSYTGSSGCSNDDRAGDGRFSQKQSCDKKVSGAQRLLLSHGPLLF